ncbi:MAG: nitrous oxide reductase accessory protein NosL [Gammaproteobacteria bacterium]|nr:nitrous oxide reductase accessory protein NosL [Gammaproteobacteria bacterium]
MASLFRSRQGNDLSLAYQLSCWYRNFFLLFLLLCLPVALHATPLHLNKPDAGDTCPVCGMFVSKYPEWLATIQYHDGHLHHFDGAKDLFKGLQQPQKWLGGRDHTQIEAIGVTEYYGLTLIDAKSAFFVIGSDQLGPMGHELIPLATQQEAEEFLKDHQGKAILRFDEVTPEVIQRLD